MYTVGANKVAQIIVHQWREQITLEIILQCLFVLTNNEYICRNFKGTGRQNENIFDGSC